MDTPLKFHFIELLKRNTVTDLIICSIANFLTRLQSMVLLQILSYLMQNIACD